MPKNVETFLTSTFPAAANEQLPPEFPLGAEDLRQLAAAISSSHGSNQLAVDILINLAAFPGLSGRPAQQALLKLYRTPEAGDLQRDDEVRARLLLAARAVCEFTLVTAPQRQGGAISLPLSLLVASMGGRCPIPEGGRDLTGPVQAHVEHRRRIAESTQCSTAALNMRRHKRG